MLPGDRYYIKFTVSRELFEDKPALDWMIYSVCQKARVALVNAGLQPWGYPKWRWLDPQQDCNRYFYACDPDSLRGYLTFRGVPVVPVQPTEWDTTWQEAN